ncbi:hypothetical protein phiLo_50 [Thermus phage phiLo]|nr:hypothetical protein phiLo_50 [Thermus phage phiLo]
MASWRVIPIFYTSVRLGSGIICLREDRLFFCRMVKTLEEIKKLLSEGKKKKNWVQEVETNWEPPEGLFTREPEEIAKVLHDESDSYAQAVRRAVFYYNRSGFCNKGGPRYDPKECSKKKKVISLLRELFGVEENAEAPKGAGQNQPLTLRVNPKEGEEEMVHQSSTSKVGKTTPPTPGTPKYLIWVSRLFISPNALARAIFDYFEDFSGYPGKPPRIIVRNRFYAIARSLVYVSGVCFPESPLYRPATCERIEVILAEAFVRYYSLVMSSKIKEK